LKRLAQLCFVSYLVSIRKLKSLNLLLKNAKKTPGFQSGKEGIKSLFINKRPSTITAHHFVDIKDLPPINPTDNRLFLFVFKEQTG